MRASRQTLASPRGATLLAVLFLATTGLAAPNNRAECLRTRSSELAALSACGDAGSINYCLSEQLPRHSHGCTAAALLKCFVNAGCTADEARIEAEWTVRRCDEKAEDEDLGELRRRQLDPNSDTPADDGGSQDSDPEPTGKNGGGNGGGNGSGSKATAAPKNTQPAAAQATTPAPAAQSQTEVVTVTQAPTDLATFTGSSSTPLVCYTNTTSSISICPTLSTGADAGKTLPCYPTQTTFATCASGLLCRTDQLGHPTCMRVDNTFSTAGIIISLTFAVAVTVAIAAMCFFCCRERRVQRRLTKEADARAIARAAAADKKRPSVSVRSVSGVSAGGMPDQQVPLMQHQGQTAVYTTNDGVNPFADQHQMRHTTTNDGMNPFVDQHQMRHTSS